MRHRLQSVQALHATEDHTYQDIQLEIADVVATRAVVLSSLSLLGALVDVPIKWVLPSIRCSVSVSMLQVAVEYAGVEGVLGLQTMKVRCKCHSCGKNASVDAWFSGMDFVGHLGKPSSSWRKHVKVIEALSLSGMSSLNQASPQSIPAHHAAFNEDYS